MVAFLIIRSKSILLVYLSRKLGQQEEVVKKCSVALISPTALLPVKSDISPCLRCFLVPGDKGITGSPAIVRIYYITRRNSIPSTCLLQPSYRDN